MTDSYNLEKDIKSARVKLIVKAEKRGVYENFGNHEIRQLEEKYNYPDFNHPEKEKIFNLFQSFAEWCMTYEG